MPTSEYGCAKERLRNDLAPTGFQAWATVFSQELEVRLEDEANSEAGRDRIQEPVLLQEAWVLGCALGGCDCLIIIAIQDL